MDSDQDGDRRAAAGAGAVEDGAATAERRRKALAEIEALRRTLPPGFRFDREEANARGSSGEPERA